MRNASWLAPLTGIAFVLLLAAAFIVGGEPPDIVDDSTQEVIDFYVDEKDSQQVSAILLTLGAMLFVFFGGVLRRVLRDGEGPGGTLSAVAFAGTIIFAVGIAIDATLTFTLAETVDDVSPQAVEALAALWNNDFLPFLLGIQVFLLATGISVLLSGALPKWIGWIAVVLGVIAVTPIGFFSVLAAGILVIVISVLLTMRGRPARPGVA